MGYVDITPSLLKERAGIDELLLQIIVPVTWKLIGIIFLSIPPSGNQ
jgi:hypothetical protein